METTIVSLSHICKSYQRHEVLKELQLEIHQGDFIAISGASGCGKSTLLNILGLLEAPDQWNKNHLWCQKYQTLLYESPKNVA